VNNKLDISDLDQVVGGAYGVLLTNTTGEKIVDLRIGSSNEQNWEGNALSGPLGHGESVFIEFNGQNSLKDMIVTTDSGKSMMWYGMRLEKAISVTLDPDGGSKIE